ncbi:26S proteasome regulatory subunit N6 [Cryptococcus neoformans C23]|uniref:Probable 26S proteasome regulatory subunit rpn-6.2 n=2 Tax=Cryptococcus neoformans TaxID=5207 RepID=A0A854Q895_CRYNE|nr:26S proteasome regulatory subunit N6 [Cryptococcus neoformans var. grubii H99]AUB28772.1 26S proteasome regulatory subunit N6 [Cryptococcus neoformans var. grubii]OWZ26926.1 26S proteasome regulatory subunit N6 [Cryptococcus neoformans var. grubii AD2-60a]OWZ27968.1 26S proteasome regulatory subunit N6 [Cryptococcus neoformans var. grubii AD1-83a]OWZ38787.1 26S proteasome regulatory subunit N6 [Cryptococcus neoformans var. grubii C23]OWZ74885.1 26S proteasome regulatory subunit N6 [Cryptoco|eukprot:XP_012053441.1 26S proteasome regulatory subunit N6 [Cryptococcus neoformans var. grubii H99]
MAVDTPTSEKLDQAASVFDKDPTTAERLYKEILQDDSQPANEDLLRDKEVALVKLGTLYRDSSMLDKLAQLIADSRTFMSHIAKAKTTKLVRTLLDLFPQGSKEMQMKVIQENIDWARAEKRVFLRQSLEIKLINVLLDAEKYLEALTITQTLLKELKKFDDKIILTEVYLLESRAAHHMHNHALAKTALTSARTTANSVYCPPTLQAQLDLQSGVIMAEDKDYKTAYSYFFEAFEGFSQSAERDNRALSALKYMLLCKIMIGSPTDVFSLLSLKSAAPYIGKDVDAMKAIATALEERSLDLFKTALQNYSDQLQKDEIIRSHLSYLYDTLLEQNLIRVIEPYSAVELSWVASEVGQSLQVIEDKLSQMILDQKFCGILNERMGTLEVHDDYSNEGICSMALGTLKHISDVVNGLNDKAAQMV